MEKPVAPRLYSNIKVADSGCWLWQRYCDNRGYGRITVNSKVHRTHRLSWELQNNQPIPKNMVIMHTCDTPACVNPAHLVLGTQRENNLDCIAKGRRPKKMKFSNRKPRKVTI